MKMSRGIFALTLCLLIAGPAYADTETDFAALENKAKAGDVEAQAQLGGQLSLIHPAQALPWLEKAAARDNADALVSLGHIYLGGRTDGNTEVAPDKTKAAGYIARAAAKNDLSGQYDLAFLYLKGDGVAKDEAKAAELFRAVDAHMFTEDDHGAIYMLTGAKIQLGLMALEGRGGVEKDAKMAVWYFRQAVLFNDPVAHFLLGRALETGEGAGKDLLGAYEHYLIAMNAGVFSTQPAAYLVATDPKAALEKLEAALPADDRARVVRIKEEYAERTDPQLDSFYSHHQFQ